MGFSPPPCFQTEPRLSSLATSHAENGSEGRASCVTGIVVAQRNVVFQAWLHIIMKFRLQSVGDVEEEAKAEKLSAQLGELKVRRSSSAVSFRSFRTFF